MNAPRWLWITAELPVAATTGRLVYSGELATAVAERGVDLTMVGLGEADEHRGSMTFYAVSERLRSGPRSLLSALPNLAYACSGPEMRRRVRELLGEPWDVIVIDHLQASWVAPMVDGVAARKVFVTHNHEASVRRRVATEAPLWNGRRPVLAFDAWKAARAERRALTVADVVTAITAEDRGRFQRDDPDTEYLVLTPGWSGSAKAVVEPVPMAQRARRVGILGSFEWHVKQENLRRFLDVADPIFADAGIELVIAGKVPDAFRAEVEPRLRSGRFLGWVEDLGAFLGACRIGVVAEPLGGGFKLKSLDYVFHHLPIATIAGSVADLPVVPGESCIEADDGGALAEAIVDVIDRPIVLAQLAARAFEQCRDRFGWDRRARDLIDATTRR